MSSIGIEAINVFAGTACIDVRKLAEHRGLDMSRFENLLMKEKTVAMPYEDPVSFGVNAAKPLLERLTDEERDRVELVITCTESAFDFGKSMSTYFHQLLGLNRNCRLIELKSACYSGVAGLQMASSFVLSGASPGAKALVIATDIFRPMASEGGESLTDDWSFLEPSGGAGAVALLIGDTPHILQLDVGANGYYGYEVMDTCRPSVDSETGNADLSLLSYLDCCEKAFLEYTKRVRNADFVTSFDYLAMHTPFGGMVKGAHRNMMRKLGKGDARQIEADFARRVAPGLIYGQRVGNIMGASTALSLISSIEHGNFTAPRRIGCFSYGSGCCSEFFSGVASSESQECVRALGINAHLDGRYALSIDEYEALLAGNSAVKFGTRNVRLESARLGAGPAARAPNVLLLRQIKEYHREYEWVS